MKESLQHLEMSPDTAESHLAAADLPGASLVVREVEAGDVDAIYALLSASFSAFSFSRQEWFVRWRWQYGENPYRGDRPAGWVLTDGDHILGHLGAVYVPIMVRDESVIGAIGADYAVADEAIAHGGMLAGLDLAQAFFAGVGDCIPMATTANEKTGAIFARFGCRPVPWTREFWRASATVSQLLRSCGGAQSRLLRWAMSGIVGGVAFPLLGACYRGLRCCPAIPIPAGCRLETTVPQLARNLGRLYERVAAMEQREGSPQPIGWRVAATQTYLHWRYVQHPERDKVRVLVVRDAEGEAIGSAFLFCDDNSAHRVVYVEELVTLPDRLDVVRTLLCSALKMACDHGADYVVTMSGRRSVRHVYWELGFESRARSAPAAIIHTSALPESFDDQVDFWHGIMF